MERTHSWTSVESNFWQREPESYGRPPKKWRAVLESVVNATLFLRKQNLHFRGHCESFESKIQGNFLETVKLLAKYNPALNKNLPDIQHSKKTVTAHLSPTIQNELILLLGKKWKPLFLKRYETLNTLQSCVTAHLTYLIRIKWLL